MGDNQKYSVGKSILKGLASAGVLAGGIGLTAIGTQIADPATATTVFEKVPLVMPLGALAFQFAGTFLVNFAKQKLLKGR